ncbi:transcriptional regulator [Microbacterium sp. 18062]|uniref:helix-turn-helix transcriptional regulator n=1 Tax=Microbacterium sp. 18062 TaxID=2681410 RepID=UPI001359B90F|nr:PAS domain-containing protein [Microbacterium sp. 18062]
MSTPIASPDTTPSDQLTVTHDSQPLSMASLTTLIEKLGDVLPPSTEIILHDFADIDATVVAVGGALTDRVKGDPPTDLLLAHFAAGATEDLREYVSHLPDGRIVNSSTLILRAPDGSPVGALCLNHDVSLWRRVRDIANLALKDDPSTIATARGSTPTTETPAEEPMSRSSVEHFPRSIDELAQLLISRAIAEVGVAPELMRKHHKVRVVATLEAQGMFMLRDSVETVGKALGVTRFTIYNYLSELEPKSTATEPG